MPNYRQKRLVQEYIDMLMDHGLYNDMAGFYDDEDYDDDDDDGYGDEDDYGHEDDYDEYMDEFYFARGGACFDNGYDGAMWRNDPEFWYQYRGKDW